MCGPQPCSLVEVGGYSIPGYKATHEQKCRRVLSQHLPFSILACPKYHTHQLCPITGTVVREIPSSPLPGRPQCPTPKFLPSQTRLLSSPHTVQQIRPKHHQPLRIPRRPACGHIPPPIVSDPGPASHAPYPEYRTARRLKCSSRMAAERTQESNHSVVQYSLGGSKRARSLTSTLL